MKLKKEAINPIENIFSMYEASNNLILEANALSKKALNATIEMIKHLQTEISINKVIDSTDFYTLPELCSLLKVNKATVYYWIKISKIPFHKPTGRLIFYKTEITNFLLNK